MTGSQAVFRRFVCVDIELQLDPLCFRYYEHYKLSTCGNCFIPCQQQREHIFKDDLCHGNMQNGCLSFLYNYNSFFPTLRGGQM